MMRCEIFSDPLYASERYIEFDPAHVVAMEERTIRLVIGRKYRVTEVTFRDGRHYLLRGEVAAHIEAGRRHNEVPIERL